MFSLVKLHIAFKRSPLFLLLIHCSDERQMYQQAKLREYIMNLLQTCLCTCGAFSLVGILQM